MGDIGNRKKLGMRGEEIAEKHLKKNGYKILAKNWFFRWGNNNTSKGEIDIIAKKQGVIIFVEVKTAIENDNFHPEQKVNFKKKQKLIKLAQIWLTQNKIPLDAKYQIDVIGIEINPYTEKEKINHFENAVCQQY
jgi:putative endonuclease